MADDTNIVVPPGADLGLLLQEMESSLTAEHRPGGAAVMRAARERIERQREGFRLIAECIDWDEDLLRRAARRYLAGDLPGTDPR